MNASLAVFAASLLALQQPLFGVPNPKGPVAPTTPTRPPVKLQPPATTPQPRKPTEAQAGATTTTPSVPGAPVAPRLPSPTDTEALDQSGPDLPVSSSQYLAKRYRPAPDRVTLPELFALLRERSPRHRASEAEIEVAEAEVKAARVLPNPILNLAILYLNSGFNQNGVGTYYANVTLPLLIAGQRRQRVRTAHAGVDVAKGTVKQEFEALAYEARSLFVQLQADQARLELFETVLGELDELQKLVETRRDSGAPSRYDRIWASIDRAAWRSRRAQAESEAADTGGRLAVLVGDPAWQPHVVGEFKPIGLSADITTLWPDALRERPDIELARRQEAYAHRTIDLAKREAWPVPSITAGTVVIQNYFSVSTSVGVTVPIPMFDFGQGLLARARAHSKRAQLDKDATIAEARAELARALRKLHNQQEILADYERDIGAQFPALKAMSEDAFRSGLIEFSGLADAVEARVELERTRIDLVEAVMLAEVDVLAAAGRIEATESR